jgi:hypothetical protein
MLAIVTSVSVIKIKSQNLTYINVGNIPRVWATGGRVHIYSVFMTLTCTPLAAGLTGGSFNMAFNFQVPQKLGTHGNPRHLWLTKWHWSRGFSKYLWLSLQYHATNAPCSLSVIYPFTTMHITIVFKP